jgi:predicted nucleotide-binding protein (sugar kinase/HSP70/actin superfamily)
MSYGAARATAAAFSSINIQAEVLPVCTNEALSLSALHTSGDECLPQRVTLGGFLEIVNKPGFDPSRAALLMPTAHGPCRFGQYSSFIKKVLMDIGYGDVIVFSPTCQDGYEGFGINGYELVRTTWRAIVVSDILRKLLLKTRPYESQKGNTDRVHFNCLENVCNVLAISALSHRKRLRLLKEILLDVREIFRKIPRVQEEPKPLIGAVGEIYCRLDDGSNDDIIRIIEDYGGEVWLSGICEWVEYTNDEVIQNLRETGLGFSVSRAVQELRRFVQRHDEHELVVLFREDFRGYEEPRSIVDVLRRSEKYIPSYATLGEMVINTGRAVYLYEKGVDGIVDISPFTCMNGIVCEAVYPKISRDHNNIPIKVFYFDGKTTDRRQDVEMFMELLRDYKARKQSMRIYADRAA